MREELLYTGTQPLLHNSGGPRSRTRTEAIERSVISRPEVLTSKECMYLQLPEGLSSPEEWLTELSRRAGFRRWQDADRSLDLPNQKMVVTKLTEPMLPVADPREILRMAMILSRTNSLRYLPAAHPVLTLHRLNRCLMLVHINLNVYYEMDGETHSRNSK